MPSVLADIPNEADLPSLKHFFHGRRAALCPKIRHVSKHTVALLHRQEKRRPRDQRLHSRAFVQTCSSHCPSTLHYTPGSTRTPLRRDTMAYQRLEQQQDLPCTCFVQDHSPQSLRKTLALRNRAQGSCGSHAHDVSMCPLMMRWPTGPRASSAARRARMNRRCLRRNALRASNSPFSAACKHELRSSQHLTTFSIELCIAFISKRWYSNSCSASWSTSAHQSLVRLPARPERRAGGPRTAASVGACSLACSFSFPPPSMRGATRRGHTQSGSRYAVRQDSKMHSGDTISNSCSVKNCKLIICPPATALVPTWPGSTWPGPPPRPSASAGGLGHPDFGSAATSVGPVRLPQVGACSGRALAGTGVWLR